jgi:imidazolonepropionase-like amidohydrolase
MILRIASRFPVAALHLFLVAAQMSAQTKPTAFLLRNVSVVDTRSGQIATHRSVLVDGGNIISVLAVDAPVPAGVRTIDASGKFVVPGFADMHIHLTELTRESSTPQNLMLANGVTLAREESITPEFKQRAAELNAEASAGTVLAPEIVFQGVEAHLPPNVSAETASNNGMPSMDHLGAGLGLVLDCSTQADAIRAEFLAKGYKPSLPPSHDFILNPRAFDGATNARFYQRVLDTYSPEKCKSLAETFVKNGTWQTVTLIRLRTQDWGNDTRWRSNPQLKYLPTEVRENWNALGDLYSKLPDDAVKTLQDYYTLQLKVTKLMADSGVKILAGSDVGGIWLVPGFSLHDEFHELAAAGLTPLQVLQTTTLNPALFLHREATSGSVDAGKEANLVVLDANPLLNILNLDKIFAVIVKGHYLSREDIDRMTRPSVQHSR